MLLEENATKSRGYDVIMEKPAPQRLTTTRPTTWPSTTTTLVKPVPERPEPVYPAGLMRPDLLSAKPTASGGSQDFRGMINLSHNNLNSALYPFPVQLPMASNMPKYLPFGPLLYHAKYPLGKKTFRCPQCRYVTDRKNNLKRHIATMHQDCGKPLECCEIHFKSKAALRDHVMLFHRAGYKCRYCGRNFCRKALLKRHLAVHNGQKDFICSVCDYATSHKSNLERHKKIHGPGPYSDDEDDLEMSGTSDEIDVEVIDNHPELEMLHRHHMHHNLLSFSNPGLAQGQFGHPNPGQFSQSFPIHEHSTLFSPPANLHSPASHRHSPSSHGRCVTDEEHTQRKTEDGEHTETERLSPGAAGHKTPDAQPLPRDTASDRQAADTERRSPSPVTPVRSGDVTGRPYDVHPDVAAFYRLTGSKRLFSNSYKCSECPLSFPSQLQLALHARECKHVTSTMTSLPSWSPFMLHSSPLGLPMPFPGLGLSPFSVTSPLHYKLPHDDKMPFWPFSLHPASPEKTHSQVLPPKKRSLLAADTSMPMDYRASTLTAATSQ